MADPSDLSGRTIIITGAASGIGRALALGFVADGADVVAADVNEAGLIPLADAGCRILRTDVTSDNDVRAMAAFAEAGSGRIDVLFNNAGVGGGGDRIEDLPEGAFEHCLASHLTGALYGLRAVMPVMRRQRYGRIINTLSRGAEAKRAGWGSYAAAKAGMFALTRVAADEGRDAGILVNGMIPGPTRTGMNRAPDLQPPEAVYPGCFWLATLPDDGPTGKVFWNRREYRLFEHPPMTE
ncbi:SDR family NAD(P)-dependent oxidoreductase [bacterium]|nr:SDR family NAD(P)-dependent oxidoreductase [bacterium]